MMMMKVIRERERTKERERERRKMSYLYSGVSRCAVISTASWPYSSCQSAGYERQQVWHALKKKAMNQIWLVIGRHGMINTRSSLRKLYRLSNGLWQPLVHVPRTLFMFHYFLLNKTLCSLKINDILSCIFTFTTSYTCSFFFNMGFAKDLLAKMCLIPNVYIASICNA